MPTDREQFMSFCLLLFYSARTLRAYRGILVIILRIDYTDSPECSPGLDNNNFEITVIFLDPMLRTFCPAVINNSNSLENRFIDRETMFENHHYCCARGILLYLFNLNFLNTYFLIRETQCKNPGKLLEGL